MPPTGVDFAASSVRTDCEVVELPLLLPRWQVLALESAAQRHGITTGQMIRRALSEMLPATAQPAS